MPLTREQKIEVVDSMAHRIESAQAIVIADYRGLDVAEMTELRSKLRQDESEMQVIKNTLVRRAFEQAGIGDVIDDLFEGPTAVVLLREELAGPAKTLKAFVKDTQALEIKGGFMNGKRLDAASVEALADLPTREELLGSFIGVLQAPMRNLVGVLSAPSRDLVGVLSARGRGEGAAEAEAA